MKAISLKLESAFLSDIEQMMKRHRYTTKTEFIREAIRDKMSELEKEERLRKVDRLYGASKIKTTDKQLHKAREKAFEELEKEIRKDSQVFSRH
ncbi:MAG: ribbon-helix-helix domain-containing protein [Nanoarchaeota archaeon]